MRRRIPWFGWLGFAGLVLGEALLLLGRRWTATWFTPWMWTAYILAIDALVARRTGRSWLTTRGREVPLLVLCSVAVWVLFEAYNFHLVNWVYVHVPPHPVVRLVAFFWSFATIMPGIFETADLAATYLPAHEARGGNSRPAHPFAPVAFILGAALVTIPLAVPQSAAAYLFAMVWVGFVPLLEPLNLALGVTTPISQCLRGTARPVVALLVSGFACGLLWEAWNYQAFLHAGAYWVYTIPEPLRVLGLHYGKMPLLGLGGFPPFAVELASFYALLKYLLGGERLFGAEAL